MPRNFDRRVEVVAPVEDRRLHARVASLLETRLADSRQAWDLFPDGSYVQRKPGAGPVISTHERLLQNSWGLTGSTVIDGDGVSRPSPAEQTVNPQSAAPTSSS